VLYKFCIIIIIINIHSATKRHAVFHIVTGSIVSPCLANSINVRLLHSNKRHTRHVHKKRYIDAQKHIQKQIKLTAAILKLSVWMPGLNLGWHSPKSLKSSMARVRIRVGAVDASRAWKNLPSPLCQVHSVDTFRCQLKTFVFAQAF